MLRFVLLRAAPVAFAFGMTGGIAACGDQSVSRREPPNFVPDGSTADGGGSGEAGVPTRDGLARIATFNVRRLFDTTCDSGRCGPNEFEDTLTAAQLDAKAETIAKGIVVVQPDVIALQEIENDKSFDVLRGKLTALGYTYPFSRVGETGYPGSIDSAILAKGSDTEVISHQNAKLKRPDGSATTFSRDLLEVRMTLGGRKVVMFAAHFKAKVDDDPGRRFAEAQAARDIVAATAAELPDALVVMGGDLNDTPASPPLVELEKGGLLVRVAADRPEDKQATYVFQGQLQAIDHLYVAARQKGRYVSGSATAFRDGNKGFAGSDHAALGADFDLK